jgi:hypothetical protein
MFSTTTLELIAEFHASHEGLDPVTTDEARLHDAVHAYLGLGVSLEEEEVVLNCVNALAGLGCSAHLTERVEFLLSLLEVDTLIELSAAVCSFNY